MFGETTLRNNLSISQIVALGGSVAISATVLWTGHQDYLDMHIMLDTSMALLPGVLSLLFWDMGTQLEREFPKFLGVSFAMTCVLQFGHMLVGVEWPVSFSSINQAENVLRPTTWPPPAHLLPIGIAGSIWLMRQGGKRIWAFSAGLILLSLALFAIFRRLPLYTPPGPLGITRPALFMAPLLWTGVGLWCWRWRTVERLLPTLALMAITLLIANSFMLYSRSPHDSVAIVAHVVMVAGYLLLLLAVMQMASTDMRERITAERKFRGLLESAPDAMVIVNEAGVIVLVNSQTEQLFGYSRRELLDQKVEMLIPDRFRLNHTSHRTNYFSEPRVRPMGAGFELHGRRKDGSEFPVEISLSPLEAKEGVLVSHSIRDVSERHRIQLALQEKNFDLESANLQLEATNNELEAFSYSVSHDLRAPLRHLIGFGQLLQTNGSSSLDQEGRHYVTTIVESAQRMGNLIDNLLAFSRLGRTELQKQPVDLDRLVAEVVRGFQREADERNIKWSIGSFGQTQSDASLLRSVFNNLISNSMKFTRNCVEPTIEIGSRVEADELVVFVRDNGAGFDMEYADKLFGVFQRLHRLEEFEGTGIGLANVRRIIHRHGGRTWAEGAVNQGATFYFLLPLIVR